MVTLATLESATAQEVYNQVVNHCFRQSKRCLWQGSCRYLSGEYMCAAGCLIARTEYLDMMEGKDWEQLIDHELVPEAHRHLIFALQDVHDNHSVREWEKCFADVANEFDLDDSIISDFTFNPETECYSFNG